MSTVNVTVEINASAEQVWSVVMDPSRWGEWVTIHKSAKLRSAHPDVKGAELDQVMRMRGVSFKVHWTLSAVRKPEHAEWTGRGPALSKASICYDLSGPPEGPTTFTYVNEFAGPGGALGVAASRILVGSEPEREARESLARLKALLER